MEDNNILSKGVYILYEIKDDLVRNNGLKQRSAQLSDDEKRYSKQLDSSKKAEASEINGTIAKRRSDIENSFSSQLGQARTQMKKAQARRANEKNSKMTKRIKSETEDLREEIRSNKEDIRSIFSRNDIPSIFNNGFFYSMFMPRSLKDFGIIGITLLAILVLPLALCLFVFPETMHGFFKAVIYILIVAVFVGIYVLIRIKIVSVHKKDFRDVNQHRNKITNLKRRITKKEQIIRKDPNESGYELGKFDEEINDIQNRIDTIVEEKKEAMTLFETKTKLDIADGIRTRYASEIEEDQRLLEFARDEKHRVDEELNELTVKISKNYEPYLGRDVLTPLVIDSLIDIINNGNAETVGEAIDFYKKDVDKSIQLN